MNAPVQVQGAAPLVQSSFVVEGLRCAGCIAKLEAGLTRLPDIAAARVNFSTRRVAIDHVAGLDESRLLAAIEALGFTAHRFAGDAPDPAARETRALALALAVAGFAAMNVMLLSVSIWSGADPATRTLFHWLSALIALPAIAYAGRPFFRSAWAALRRGRTNMDVPISIGVTLTAAMSLYETATGGAHAYFDGAVMLLFFLLGGRLLDAMMRAQAEDGVAALLRRVPAEATLIDAAGTPSRQPLALIAAGMRVQVAAGERIAVDGVVETGDSLIDRALVTGESLPEPVRAGGTVLAGTTNVSAPLIVRVTATAEATAVAEIARLMQAAAQGKSRYVRLADRAARAYAPAVHALALASLTGWLIAGASFHQALTIAVAVLIITCPCALGLAVPIAQVVAAGALMRRGVLVKDGSALERLAAATRVILDKTGTVTLGTVRVTGGLPTDSAARSVLRALAEASRHLLSRAVAEALAGTPAAPIASVREETGFGVAALAMGQEARLGRPDWALGGEAEGATAFAWGPVRATIQVADAPRPDAPAAIAALKALGLDPVLLSGDHHAAVAALARALHVTAAARLTPADKHDRVAALERAGVRVLMVGDGINDGPALKAASVAMAPAGASDVGQRAADALFFGSELGAVPAAVRAARRTMRVVRQNLALAIGYNIVAVPLAIAGQVTPLIAALAMSGSSLLVVGNALRLRGAAR